MSYVLIFIFAFLVENAYASYVIYHNNNAPIYNSAPITRTLSSFPYPTSGFYYSDPYGNSMGYSEIRSFPVVTTQYPGSRWVDVYSGSFPANPIVYLYINGRPVFYCRVIKGNQIFYGWLDPNQGCYLFSDINQQPYSLYQTLIR